MPTLMRDDIVRIANRILQALGTPESAASTVADHLADSNLTGHDSHGLIRVVQYANEVKSGAIDAAAEPEIVLDSDAVARVDGRMTFGVVGVTLGTNLAIDRARKYGVGLATMYNLAHTGRMGAYPEEIAREGMAGIMCTALSWPVRMAPFGGREPRLATNPMAISFPYLPDSPLLLDMASTVTAEGKIRVYRNRGEKLPDQWVVRKDGVPTTNPADLYEGGALLPLGGMHGGHKGYALNFMIVALGMILAYQGKLEPGHSPPLSGSTVVAIDLDRLGPVDALRATADQYVQYVKDTPFMEGHQDVLYPGELEARTRRQRLAEGVELEQATWDQLAEVAREYGVAQELGMS